MDRSLQFCNRALIKTITGSLGINSSLNSCFRESEDFLRRLKILKDIRMEMLAEGLRQAQEGVQPAVCWELGVYISEEGTLSIGSPFFWWWLGGCFLVKKRDQWASACVVAKLLAGD